MVGAVYASLAVGFSLIFGVARIINLAHTAFFMLAAYFMFSLVNNFSLNFFLLIILSVSLVTILGTICYKLFLERIREHEGAVLLVTVALAIAIQECILLFYGSLYKSLAPFVPGNAEFLGVTIPWQELIILGVTIICLIGLLLFLYRTNCGLALRVTAQDRETANLMGINVQRICLLSISIAIGLAGLAGAIVGPIYTLEPLMWAHPLVMMFAAVILGGLGSIKGSFIGAFILGYTEVLVVFLAPEGSFIKGPVAMGIMVLILLIKREGLFGISFEEERL